MELKEFFNTYLTKLTDKQRLGYVREKLRTEETGFSIDERAFLYAFVDLLYNKPKEALRNLEIGFKDKGSLLVQIGLGLIHLKLAQRDKSYEDAQDAVRCLEGAIAKQTDIPFLYIRLARAYRTMGYLSEDIDGEKNYDMALFLINKAIDMIVKENTAALSYAYNERGDIYLKKRKYNLAIDDFDEAISKHKQQPYSYIGKGNALRVKNQLIEAIKYYETAIAYFKESNEGEPTDNIECTYPLNYIGDCYRYMEDYTNAEERYHKATHIDSTHAFPWNGLGRVYYELGNRKNCSSEFYKKAKEYFDKALLANPKFKYAKYNSGRVNEKLGDYSEAKKCYEAARDLPPHNAYWKEIIHKQIEDIEERILQEAISESFRITMNNDTLSPAETIILQTKWNKIEETVFHKKDSFSETFLKERYYISDEDKDTIDFEVLRRWNSYTPIITDGSKGGGYFIKAYGMGIVIDPGFNFIENFIGAKHQFADIDIVLISHAHDDHTADLESITNLLYRYNKELRENKLVRQIAKESCTPQNIVKETKKEEIETRFNKYRKILSFFISKGVMKKYLAFFDNENCCILNEKENTIDGSNKCSYEVRALDANAVINLGEKKDLDNPKIQISSLLAKHEDIIKDENGDSMASLGFKLDFGETVLIYTGDTGWSSEMEAQYNSIRKDCEGKYVILLAHIGGFDKNESRLVDHIKSEKLLIKDKNTKELKPEMFYDKHLGRLGLVRITEVLEADLCIISEFGEEFRGYRVDIADIYNQALAGKLKTCFLPADIGLKIKIKNTSCVCPQVKAITRIDRENRRIEYSYVDSKQVKVGEYLKKNKLFYYDKNAGVNESECLQAYFEDFSESFCMNKI